MTTSLFTPLELGKLVIPNRIVVSPMAQYSADEGCAGDWHLVHLGHLSYSGAGLVMTEATAVEASGRGSLKCLGLYSDAQEAALRRIIDFCHAQADVRMGVQLSHFGRKGSVDWKSKGPLPIARGGWETVAPSALAYDAASPVPRELGKQEIAALIQSFASAAERAVRAGFDVIEIHAAHGYLLHQFFSPISNVRRDEYGGDLERRMRFPLEVASAVREAVPADRAVGFRISAHDWVEGGSGLEEAVAFATALRSRGCDYVCVSTGGLTANQKIKVAPAYQVPHAETVRRRAGIVTRAVGLITRPDEAESIIASGKADMIALGRAILDNPRWGWHAAEALGENASHPRQYERCSRGVWPGAKMIRPDRETAGVA